MTPEALLVEMTALWGEEAATTVWLFLDQRLAGRRLYWPARVRRDLLASAAYDAAKRGDHPLSIARRLGVTRRTVDRWIAAERRRRRNRQGLPKTHAPDAET